MLFLKKVIILFLTVVIMVAAYSINGFLKAKINPRASFGHFFLFILLNFLTIFLLVFLLGLFLFRYKDFFFKQ